MSAAQQSDASASSDAAAFNRRRNWRESVIASGVLTAPGVNGAAASRLVRVTNLSAGGVGIVSPTPLSVGAEFLLDIAGRPDRSGRVRVAFCRQTPTGYETGTEFVRG